MFEKIILRKSDKGPSLSAGELAEALLFYQNVHLILDFSSLGTLISQIGMPNIVSLLNRPNVSAIYCENSVATQTDTRNNISTHSFIAYSFAGDREVGQLHSRKQILEWILTKKHGYDKKKAKQLVERFRLKVPFRDLTGNHFIEGGIIEAARLDLFDESFIHSAVSLALEDYVGHENVPPSFRFQVHNYEKGFQIDTDLNFDEITKLSNQRNPSAGERNAAHLIGTVLDARADTVLASHYGGEFYTSGLTSRIICRKHSELLRRMKIETDELHEFSEIVVDTGPTLREVINSNERTFEEFLKLLDRAQKFKEFIQDVNPDEKLVKEYWEQVTSQGWINSLPTKVIRYVVGSVISAIEPITGHAFSVADSFLLERILGGWRPNHFVEGQLKPFIEKDRD